MKSDTARRIPAIVALLVMFFYAGCRSLPGSQAHLSPRDAISLAGKWRFKLDGDNLGPEQKWYATNLPGRITLPGSTAENGYGDDVSVDTKWTGSIIDRSWFTDPKFEQYRRRGSIRSVPQERHLFVLRTFERGTTLLHGI